MKERLIDIGSMIESSIRVVFYTGAGMYLAAKAMLVIPGNPDIPNMLVIPVSLVALFGGIILAHKVTNEPTPKEQRKLKRNLELLEEWVKELDEKHTF